MEYGVHLPKGIFSRGLEEAAKSTYKQRMGAVIFKGTRIISSGHNQIRSSPIHPKHKVWYNSLHAEQHALLYLDWSMLAGSSIFVCRINRNGTMLPSRPCPMCMKLINFIGLSKVYYFNDTQLVRE